MARLYTNENFRRRIVEILREFGHDVLTFFEAENANLSIPDDKVLGFATENERIILTFNRKDFIQLHNQNPTHSGIIVCTENKDNIALAQRIHNEIVLLKGDSDNQLIRVNRPNVS
jgi:predicted nuclease of predicted toxin-antitoxin system